MHQTVQTKKEMKKTYKILYKKELTPSTFVLGFEKNGMQFEAGQHLLAGKADDIHFREYSIYSGTNDPNLEILVKEVINGQVSKTLKSLDEGDEVEIQGPLGFFTIDEELLNGDTKFLFIASGTGISPFRSMIKSHPGLNYTLLHGIRHSNETYGIEDYDDERYISCVTGDDGGKFKGRVTDWIKTHPIDKDTHCYLCGNFEMIRDAMDLLEEKGIPQSHLHAEVYF